LRSSRNRLHVIRHTYVLVSEVPTQLQENPPLNPAPSQINLINITKILFLRTLVCGVGCRERADRNDEDILARIARSYTNLQDLMLGTWKRSQCLHYQKSVPCLPFLSSLTKHKRLVFSNQLVNPATSSPADDVHHYIIPPKLLLTNRFYFQQTSAIHAPVGKRKDGSLSGRSPAPIADSSNVATNCKETQRVEFTKN
jgi:hypothetical protein